MRRMFSCILLQRPNINKDTDHGLILRKPCAVFLFEQEIDGKCVSRIGAFLGGRW
jgi:hypothetical protein